MKLYFTAAEPSGDLLGREVIEAIRACAPDIELAGIGGGEMASVGIASPFDTAPLSILGYAEAITAYPKVLELAEAAATQIIETAPDAAVLIDSWGFTIRVAQRVRARAPQIRLIKLIGPQVWATRAGRARKIAAVFDHVLCIHQMEVDYYAPFGIRTTVIGNPALSRAEAGDGNAFRARHGFKPDTPLVLILPGSRTSELKRVAPVLVDAARLLRAERPETQIAALPATSIADGFAALARPHTEWLVTVRDPAERFDAMAAADLALACSGTVTSELAVQRAPMLVAYRLGWVTWAAARFLLYRREHITMLNIAAGDRQVVPEFVQTRCRSDLIAAAAEQLLADDGGRQQQIAAQDAALRAMGQGEEPAPEIAAQAILDDVRAALAPRLSR